MVEFPEKLSPLNDLAAPDIKGINGSTDVGVELSERLCQSLVQVQAWPDSAGKVETTLRKAVPTDATVMPTGPARWMVESDTDDLETVLRDKIGSDTGAVTGLTHARVVVEIKGPKATWVLASGIALDFDVATFPVGQTRLSHVHEIGVTVHRIAEDQFDLYVFTSLSRGFWHWIATASMEVGYRVS